MPDFPGRIFLIESVCGSTKHEIKNLRLNTPQANITVRNYPLTVNEFRKKQGYAMEANSIYLPVN